MIKVIALATLYELFTDRWVEKLMFVGLFIDITFFVDGIWAEEIFAGNFIGDEVLLNMFMVAMKVESTFLYISYLVVYNVISFSSSFFLSLFLHLLCFSVLFSFFLVVFSIVSKVLNNKLYSKIIYR